MASWIPPFAFGEKSPTQAAIAGSQNVPSMALDLGKKWVVNGNEYKLVKATAAFTAANIQSLICLDAGTTAKTHSVAATSGGVSNQSLIAGIASPNQVALAIGDFFLVQTDGRATIISGGSTVSVAQTTGASGRCLDMTAPGALANVPASIASYIGVAHASVAAAATVEVDLAPIA